MTTKPEGLDPKAANVTSQWAHDRPLIACRFDPTGAYVFCGSEDAVVTRFRLSDGAKTVLAGGHTTWVAAFAFSNDGKVVVSGGCDGKVNVVVGDRRGSSAHSQHSCAWSSLGAVTGRQSGWSLAGQWRKRQHRSSLEHGRRHVGQRNGGA